MKKNILIVLCVLGINSVVGPAECKKKKKTSITSEAKKAQLLNELQQLVYSLNQQIKEFETEASNALVYAKQSELASTELAAKAAASPEKNVAVDDASYENASESAASALAYASSIQQSIAFVAAGVDQAIEKTKKMIKA